MSHFKHFHFVDLELGHTIPTAMTPSAEAGQKYEWKCDKTAKNPDEVEADLDFSKESTKQELMGGKVCDDNEKKTSNQEISKTGEMNLLPPSLKNQQQIRETHNNEFVHSNSTGIELKSSENISSNSKSSPPSALEFSTFTQTRSTYGLNYANDSVKQKMDPSALHLHKNSSESHPKNLYELKSQNFTAEAVQFFNCSHPSSKESTQSAPIDFYFLLGSIGMKRNSITLERSEFRCLHCRFSTAWRPSLVKHMKRVHGEILDIHPLLEIRNVKFLDKEHVSSNLTKQRNDYKVLKMSDYLITQKKAKIRPCRPRKLEYQDVPGQFPCLICHKVFTRLRYLRRHRIVHRNERSHLCDLCGKSFKTRAVLVSHRCSNHTDTQRTSYHCPQCGFISSNRTAIHKHRQLHPCESLLCHVCGAAYPDRSTLRRHARVHDPSRPFACCHSGCTWRFKTEVMCKAHERGHLSQSGSKFQCPFCGYNFRHKHHLQRHVAKFHTDHQATASETDQISLPDITSLPQSSSCDSSNELPQHPLQSHSLGQKATILAANVAQRVSDDSSHLNQGPNHDVTKHYTPQQATRPLARNAVHGLQAATSIKNSSLRTPDHSYPSAYFSEHDSSHSPSKEDLILLQTIEENTNGEIKDQDESLSILQGQLDLAELLEPGQTLMAHDQYGNVVHYKVTEIGNWQNQDIGAALIQEQLSHSSGNTGSVYFIDVDG